jgi:predicted nucleic-acid-binding protein
MAWPKVGLDTNVVLRLMTGDDATQFAQALKQLETHDGVVSAAVLMECEWVLRGFFKQDASTIALNFRHLLDAQGISAQHPFQMNAILDAFEGGLDFADAVHACQCDAGNLFVTFDKAFAKRATKLGLKGIKLLGAKR